MREIKGEKNPNNLQNFNVLVASTLDKRWP